MAATKAVLIKIKDLSVQKLKLGNGQQDMSTKAWTWASDISFAAMTVLIKSLRTGDSFVNSSRLPLYCLDATATMDQKRAGERL
jgi:hypothetical protein